MDNILSITEQSNFLTEDLDVSVNLIDRRTGAFPFLRLLRESDAQLFAGFQGFEGTPADGLPNVYDEEVVDAINAVADGISRSIEAARIAADRTKAVIAVAGAGTSGRLAFFVCRAFSHLLRDVAPELEERIRFVYLTAGGDEALLRAREKTEDDTQVAVEDLVKTVESVDDCEKVSLYYIGVTCGFSAPYVASQLDLIWRSLTAGKTPLPESVLISGACLLGFNPLFLARKTMIEGWDRSFADVCSQIFESDVPASQRFSVVNPVVGPEALTGSTRMKGGSATKMLLEVIMLRSFAQAGLLVANPVRELLLSYETAYRHVYDASRSNKRVWSDVIVSAGESLSNNGRVLYFSRVPTFGILGFVDASECVPTFGASGLDVRGFVGDGWATLGNVEGDLSNRGQLHQLSLDSGFTFLQESVAESRSVTAIILDYGPPGDDGLHQRLTAICGAVPNAKVFAVRITVGGDYNVESSDECLLNFPRALQLHDRLPLALPEFALKLVLNAITTGAHVARGKVIKNVMADVGVSNNKLYYRARRIVAEFAGVDEDRAEEAVLRAIWQTDEDLTSTKTRPISDHIDQAAKVKQVVPMAVLLASGRCQRVTQAADALRQEHVVRKLLL